jgi:hypothetical protein
MNCKHNSGRHAERFPEDSREIRGKFTQSVLLYFPNMELPGVSFTDDRCGATILLTRPLPELRLQLEAM